MNIKDARFIYRREIANNLNFFKTNILRRIKRDNKNFDEKEFIVNFNNELNSTFYKKEEYSKGENHLNVMTLENMYCYNLFLEILNYEMINIKTISEKGSFEFLKNVYNRHYKVDYNEDLKECVNLPNKFVQPKTNGDLVGYYKPNNNIDELIKLKTNEELLDKNIIKKIKNENLNSSDDVIQSIINKTAKNEHNNKIKYINLEMNNYKKNKFNDYYKTCYKNSTKFEVNDSPPKHLQEIQQEKNLQTNCKSNMLVEIASNFFSKFLLCTYVVTFNNDELNKKFIEMALSIKNTGMEEVFKIPALNFIKTNDNKKIDDSIFIDGLKTIDNFIHKEIAKKDKIFECNNISLNKENEDFNKEIVNDFNEFIHEEKEKE